MSDKPKISIIIPVYNEEKLIAGTLADLGSTGCELIVADGGSVDNTAALAEEKGARVISSEPGRGRQLNRGAEEAGGEILFFLHADTLPPPGFQYLIINTLAKKDIMAGFFSLGINAEGFSFRLLEKGAALRSSCLNMPYGDQGMFLTKKRFNEVGGFPETEIMEDVRFVKKLAGKGKIELLPEKVSTSGRRWSERGLVRVTVVNQLLLCGFFLGVPARFLARFYYGRKDI